MSSFADQRVRRPIGMLLLACMVILFAGVPLPVLRQKVTSTPFPCQDSPCGCNTAAQCWDKCCCHSDAEKLAWAEKNGISPPAFLVERVAGGRENSIGVLAKAKRPACCSAPKPETASCCAKLPAKMQSQKNDVIPAPKTNVSVVLLEAMNKCKGIDLAIRLFPAGLVGIRRPAFEVSVPFFLYAMILGDDAADSLSAPIDPPIP